MRKILYALILVCLFGCEAVFIEDISNDTVVVLAPVNNSQLNTGNNTFSWERMDDADTYQIQIAQPDFMNANQIILDSITSLNSVTHNLDAGMYQWRVKALNSEYETQYITVNFIVN